MAEISKQALKVENNTSFPNNNVGAITPSILRAFNVDMIDSLVDEQSYNVDSASWNQQIDALEQFSASASGLTTGSLLVTASAVSNVITFTKGNGSTFNVTVADTTDLSQLNQATASLQQYTASANIKFTNLESTTASLLSSVSQLNASSASQQVSINNLNTTTASLLVETQNLELFSASALVSISNLNASSASQQTQINQLIAGTGSYATTGSNTFTGPNTFTSISASSFVSASEFIGNGSKITGITASIALPILDEGIPQGNAFSMNFTGSGISAVVVGGTAVVSVNTPDSGTVNNLTASFNAYTASTDLDLAALHQATASLQQFTASFSTASLVSTSSFNAYTASNNQRVSSLEANTASVNTSITNLNQSSASQQVSIDALNVYTASQSTASIVSSISQLNQATQSLFLSASLTITTASVNNDDITFTKGDGTQFTIQVATGSFALSASYAETSSITRNVVVVARNNNASTLAAGTVVHITSALGDNPVFTTASYDNEALSSNTFGLLRYSSPSGADVEVVVNGVVTGVNTDPALGYAAGDIIYLSSSGQFTKVQPQAPNQIVTLGQVLRAQQNNGSIYVSINNGWELNELHNVQINTASLATGDLLVYQSASYGLWVNRSISGAGLVSTSSFNSFTASVNSTTASLFTSASLALTTASFNNGTRNLTFTKGDATTFSVNIPDVSGSTGNFATTGSNTFVGNQIISGSFIQSGSNSFVVDPIGQGVGTWIQNRVLISGPGTGETPRLFISGSDGAFTEFGRGFINQDTTKVPTIGASIFTGAHTSSAATNTVAVYNADFSTDVELQMFANTSSVGLSDWNNSIGNYVPFIEVAPNTGNNPKPRMTRGLEVTGSTEVGTFTASLQQGFVFVGAANGRTTTVSTSSFSGGGGAGFPFTGDAVITGSLLVSGSTIPDVRVIGNIALTGSIYGQPITLSVAANTASMDMRAGNNFVLTLPSGSTTHIIPTNIIAGQTLNLLIRQQVGPGTGSIAFAPSVLFPSGLDMQATATGSAIDLVSMISFDTTNLMAANVKNLK